MYIHWHVPRRWNNGSSWLRACAFSLCLWLLMFLALRSLVMLAWFYGCTYRLPAAVYRSAFTLLKPRSASSFSQRLHKLEAVGDRNLRPFKFQVSQLCSAVNREGCPARSRSCLACLVTGPHYAWWPGIVTSSLESACDYMTIFHAKTPS